WLLIALSALLQAIIFPLPGIYVLSWIALAPLIVALLRARSASELQVAGSVRLRPATPGQGFLLGYVCGILWYAGTCYWIYDTMRHYGGLGISAALLTLFLFCCYLGCITVCSACWSACWQSIFRRATCGGRWRWLRFCGSRWNWPAPGSRDSPGTCWAPRRSTTLLSAASPPRPAFTAFPLRLLW